MVVVAADVHGVTSSARPPAVKGGNQTDRRDGLEHEEEREKDAAGSAR